MDRALEPLAWLRDRQPDRSPWSALGKAMCGTGLVFLLLTVGLIHLRDSSEGDIWWLVLHFYFYLLSLRLCGSAFFSLLLSPLDGSAKA